MYRSHICRKRPLVADIYNQDPLPKKFLQDVKDDRFCKDVIGWKVRMLCTDYYLLESIKNTNKQINIQKQKYSGDLVLECTPQTSQNNTITIPIFTHARARHLSSLQVFLKTLRQYFLDLLHFIPRLYLPSTCIYMHSSAHFRSPDPAGQSCRA